jgi:two-component system, sensor histidine kinase PdtaS
MNTILQKLNLLIEANIENSKFSVDDICTHLGLSRSQLHRVLIETTQLSTTLYIRKKRLEKAKQLLATTNLRISEITDAVGINSHANFSKYLLEKFNQLIDDNLGNLTFSRLLSTLKNTSQIRLIILCILSCFSHQINCQSPQLSPQQIRIQSVAFQKKAEWFLKLPQYNKDSAEIYFDRAINVLNKNEPQHFQALSEAYIKLHDDFFRSNFTPKVEDALIKARFYYDKIPNKLETTKPLEYEILLFEAKKSFKTENQTLANSKMLQAFSWIQEQKTPEMQARFLLDKGYLYSRSTSVSNTGAMKLGNGFLLQSMKLYEKSKVPSKYEMLFKVYSEITWYHNIIGSIDSCDYYFDKQKALLPLLKDPFASAYYCSLRANNYMRRNLQDKAVPLLKECQELLEKYKLTQNQTYVFNTYVQGVRELKTQKYENAIALFTKGQEAAKKINSPQFISIGYLHLSNAYKSKGEFKTALEYYVKYFDAEFDESDKILDKSLKENELKLDIVKKESELTQKAKERNWYIGALITGLFLLALVYRNFRLKQKSNQQLELLNGELETKNTLLDKRNAENELLLKEIHHRVKNNLEVVSSLLELQSAQIDNPAVASAMLASQNRVHSMGIIHQKLYQGEHLAAIEMRDYFINLGENIVSSFNAEGRIKVECNMPQLVLDVDTAISIGLITNELLTNSLKYAFTEKENGNINISLNEEDREGGLILKVSDDGIGKVPDQKAKGTGFGTQLISLLTRQLDGRLIYEINNGTTVLLYFKKTKLV